MHVKILIHVHWCVFKGCWRPSVHCSPKRHFFVDMPSWNSEEETEANCVQHVSMRLNKGHYRKCKNLIFSLYSRVARQNLNNADHYNIKGSHYPKNVTNCTIFLFKLWQIQTSRCTLNILNILYLNHHGTKHFNFHAFLKMNLMWSYKMEWCTALLIKGDRTLHLRLKLRPSSNSSGRILYTQRKAHQLF